jgi:aspartate racemase
MKILGLIGGIGPESTIEYYRLLIAGYRELADGNGPALIINSIDLKKFLGWMAANELALATDYFVTEIERLADAGVDVVALASNTPHIIFDEIQRRSRVPLISIVDATCEYAQSLGLRTVGLFGTRFTMQARFYPDIFLRAGITVVVPTDEEQSYIHDKYNKELLNNIFLASTRTELLSIAEKLKDRHRIEGLILGGTELPLILKDQEYNGIKMLDTTRIHVKRLLREMTAT